MLFQTGRCECMNIRGAVSDNIVMQKQHIRGVVSAWWWADLSENCSRFLLSQRCYQLRDCTLVTLSHSTKIPTTRCLRLPREALFAIKNHILDSMQTCPSCCMITKRKNGPPHADPPEFLSSPIERRFHRHAIQKRHDSNLPPLYF